MTSVPAVAPALQLTALRRLQRRLLFGGGGLVSVLIVVTAIASIIAGISEFHARQHQDFLEAQSAVDYFLSQRDRAYANSINANDALWTTQRDELRRLGRPLAPAFRAQGLQQVVRAEGRTAVPWLVLGDPRQPLPEADLEAYLGMVHEYSVYTAGTIAALQASGATTMYAYEPQGRLLAVPGMADEAQLLQTLQVPTREQAFSRLLALDAAARRLQPLPGPLESAADGGRLASLQGRNPFNGQAALVGVMTLAQGRTPFFRRVVFESINNIKARLDATRPGSYLVTSADGAVILASGPLTQSAAALAHALPPLQGEARQHQRVQEYFAYSGGLQGTGWRFTHLYAWADLWRDQGGGILLRLCMALVILSALWWLLWRMDRRVFAPALADASRVYESEALSQAIIGTAPVGLALLRRGDGAPLLQNQTARELGGEPTQEAAVPSLYAGLAAHARGLPRQGAEFNWALPGEGGEPTQLQVALASATYRDEAVWVCAVRDITAQVDLQRTLRQARQDSEAARQAAEAASRAKTAFVATMSHEIRTPLNGVLGHLELLARSPLQADQQERLQRIRLSADSLMAIISDVLDFSKIEAGQLEIDPVPFALRPLIEEAALLYVPEAQRKGVKLYYAIAPALDGSCLGDMHRIRQIINNLLSNAVKFTASGRITLRAEEGGAPVAGQLLLRLRVIDSGIGLSEEQLAQLFQPFQQGDASVSRRYGGSGLGLALCQQLAHLLGGHITVESTLGVGSVFTLEVPVQPLAADPQPEQPLTGQYITLLSAAPEWRQEIGQLLQSWGASVTAIDQPAQAVQGGGEATLLIFGERRAWSEEDEAMLRARHGRLLRAYPDGPLWPQQQADGIHVSSYASPALLRALQVGTSLDALPEAAAAPAPADARRGRVLLVEDNVVNRELIQQQLEELGCEVDAAENGQVALDGWRHGSWNIVMTDINMPIIDGYQLARALRAMGETLPVLAVTATALASERERCRAAGIDNLLLKPLDLAKLSQMLDHYLPVVVDTPLPAVAGRERPLKLRRLFVDSCSKDLQALQAAGNDGEALLEKVHALKGVLLMMGERDLGGSFADAERRLRAGQPLPATEREALQVQLGALIERYRGGLQEAP
ncbi:ATP-binding protein [Stenotrophomonas maltophilia]|uniref:hybrid sensor histidine kinase/response regulator n=1 Tax=Stenotrophomonas maltophilia TaxID=40324 RepID=UPI0039C1B684